MLIVMNPDATAGQIQRVIRKIESIGLKAHPSCGTNCTVIGIIGNLEPIYPSPFADLPGVAECVRVTKPYKLVGRELKHDKTVIRIGKAEIGGDEAAIIAGVCAVESREQTMLTAQIVAEMGCRWFRGGAFKPRTSPYAFQGLGEEGLKILSDVRDQFGLSIVTEAVDEAALDLCERYADVIQIGTRNMQNFSLLNRACNTLLPAEDGMEAPDAPARRGADDMRIPGSDATQREFTVPFDFDSDYLTLHTTRIIGEAARVAKAVKAAKIEVQGYRATTWLSNGKKFIEAQTVAEKRAKKVSEILIGLGLPAAAVSVNWKGEPEPCDGVTDPDKRRVTIKIGER